MKTPLRLNTITTVKMLISLGLLLATGCLSQSDGSKSDNSTSAPPVNPISPISATQTCTDSSDFNFSLQAKPFFQKSKVHFNSRPNKQWLGEQIVFDDLDDLQLSAVQLSSETLIFNYFILPHDHIKVAPKRLIVSMNNFRGFSAQDNAVEFLAIEKESLKPSWRISENDLDEDVPWDDVKEKEHRDRKKNASLEHAKKHGLKKESDSKNSKKEDRDSDEKELHEVYFIKVKVHLEKFIFGGKKTASDILRSSNQSNGRVVFKIHGVNGFSRVYDATLLLAGNIPGRCDKPAPQPPTPISNPTVKIDSTSVAGLTKDTSISINFSADQASVQFQCSLDSSAYTSCASPYSASSLSDGVHNFSVKAINSSGLESEPASFSWTIDATAPLVSLGVINPAEIFTSTNSISIDFSANEAVNFFCQLDGGSWSACQSPFTQSALADGDHVFSVQAQDLAGNMSSSISYLWTIKTSPPVVTITSVLPADNPSNSTNRSFYFESTEPNLSFYCSLDSGVEFLCSSPYQLSGLLDGGHLFAVVAMDKAKNRSQPATNSFTIDTLAPEISLIGVNPSQSPTNSSSIQINLASNESVSWACSLDSSTPYPCSNSVSLNNLSEGSHHFQALATDAAGNLSLPVSYDWVIDLTPPIVQLGLVNPAATNFNQNSIDLSFSVSETTTSLCTLDQALPVDCSINSIQYSSLTEGNHSITISSTDLAGNVSSPIVYNFTVDLTPPSLQIASVVPAEILTTVNNISITFISSDSVSFLCSLDGAVPSSCVSPVQYQNLTEGAHSFSVQGIDLAGNMSAPQTYFWSVDTTPPTATILSSTVPADSITALTSITLNFSSNEVGVSYICQLDFSDYMPCSSPASFSGLNDGNHSVRIIAIDAAGNVQTTPTTLSWVVDTAPLVISSVTVTSLGRNSAAIYWVTNKPSSSQIMWRIYSSSTFISTSLNTTPSTTHSMTVIGLNPNTLYYFYVASIGLNGAQQNSPVYSFRTAR